MTVAAAFYGAAVIFGLAAGYALPSAELFAVRGWHISFRTSSRFFLGFCSATVGICGGCRLGGTGLRLAGPRGKHVDRSISDDLDRGIVCYIADSWWLWVAPVPRDRWWTCTLASARVQRYKAGRRRVYRNHNTTRRMTRAGGKRPPERMDLSITLRQLRA
jgi:hypothetical protein